MSSAIRRSTSTWLWARSLERLAPDVEHRVGADQRVAHRGGLLGVQVLGLLAVLGGARGRGRRARAAARRAPPRSRRRDRRSSRRSGSSRGRAGRGRPPSAPRTAGGRRRAGRPRRWPPCPRGPAEGDRRRARDVPCALGYRHIYRSAGDCNTDRSTGSHRPWVESGAMGLIYKPFGIVLGIVAGAARQEASSTSSGRRSTTRSRPSRRPRRRRGAACWPSAALQGVIFRSTRVAVDRYGAIGWRYLTGTGPARSARTRRMTKPRSASVASAFSKAAKSRCEQEVDRPPGGPLGA